jgi:hypothetical protein
MGPHCGVSSLDGLNGTSLGSSAALPVDSRSTANVDCMRKAVTDWLNYPHLCFFQFHMRSLCLPHIVLP